MRSAASRPEISTIGTPTPGTAADVLRDGWLFCVATFLVAAAGSMLLRDVVPVTEEDHRRYREGEMRRQERLRRKR